MHASECREMPQRMTGYDNIDDVPNDLSAGRNSQHASTICQQPFSLVSHHDIL
jgi:hypothetical protein